MGNNLEKMAGRIGNSNIVKEQYGGKNINYNNCNPNCVHLVQCMYKENEQFRQHIKKQTIIIKQQADMIKSCIQQKQDLLEVLHLQRKELIEYLSEEIQQIKVKLFTN